MSTDAAAKKILKTWDALRAGEVTDEQAREAMGAIRGEIGELNYQFAKFAAAAADSRR